jgi:hypothetical protein
MSRRKRTADSSLELLLDTICNTFGGVLFLAILICVLLRMASPIVQTAQDQITPEELQAMESQLDTLVAEIETLQAAQAQQDKIAGQVADSSQKKLFDQVTKERAERDRLFQDRLRTVAEVHKTHRRTAELLKELESLRQNLETARQSIKDQTAEMVETQAERDKLAFKADELVKAMQAAQARTAPLPRQRRSSKDSVGLIVRFNRLYVWHKYDALGRAGLNTDEFVFVEDRGTHVVTMPKPYAGVPLGVSDSPAQITTRLRQFDPSDVYLTVVIWADSFQSFQTLKNTIVGLGFEYRLMPMADGQSVFDRGGADSRVQ